MRLHWLVAVIVLPVGCSQTADQVIEQRVKEVLSAKSHKERNSRYRNLFAPAKADVLFALKRSKHDSIAIQAAWEEVKLTVPEKRARTAYRPDKEKLTRFIRFLEGRSRVTVPKWWSEELLDARVNRQGDIYRVTPKHFKLPYRHVGLEGVYAPKGSTVRMKDNSYILQSGKDSVSIPDDLLVELKSDGGSLHCNIIGHFTKKHCFVAVQRRLFALFGPPHPVACIDRTTGQMTWKSKACGCHWWGRATGGSSPYKDNGRVAVVVHDDRVVVFGSARLGFWAHGFRSDNGKTLFQFSSSF